MKITKTMINISMIIFFISLLTVCEVAIEETAEVKDSGVLIEKYKYEKELWGEWIRMDTGNTWYFASNYYQTTEEPFYPEFQKQSANVIKVTEYNNQYYLYASRITNGSFNGSVVGDQANPLSSVRALSGLGGINIIVSNLYNKADEVNVKVDEDGRFEAQGIIPGDNYEITVDDISIPVQFNTTEEDIGTVTVVSGLNFKTSVLGYGEDMMQLYTGNSNTYNIGISVKNTSNVTCAASSYKLILPEDIFIGSLRANGTTSGLEGILGSILPGATKSIEIYELKCLSVIDEYEFRKIDIEIKDNVSGTIWNDSVSLKFNRDEATINILSDGPINGIVIVPTGMANG